MNRTSTRLLAVMLALVCLLFGCNNNTQPPKTLSSISVSTPENVKIEDYENGVELPKAAVTATYSDGSTGNVTSASTFSAAKITSGEEGTETTETLDSMTVTSKGSYRVSVTYSYEGVTRNASYEVSVYGDERLLVSGISDDIKELYDGDTLDISSLTSSATAKYEDENGATKNVDVTWSVTDEEEASVENNATLKTGNYTLTASYKTTGEETKTVTSSTSFSVSSGLLPKSFTVDLSSFEKVNKTTSASIDFSNLKATVTYGDDGHEDATLDIALNTEGIKVAFDNTEVTNLDSIEMTGYEAGHEVKVVITIPQATAGAVKSKDGNVTKTEYTPTGDDLTFTGSITVIENAYIKDDVTITSVEGADNTVVPYTIGDTIRLADIKFTYMPGDGTSEDLTGESDGVTVKVDDKAVTEDYKIAAESTTFTLSYKDVENSKTLSDVPARARAKSITIASADIKSTYTYNSSASETITLPTNVTFNVTYEDGTTGEVAVTDFTKLTMTLTKEDSASIYSRSLNGTTITIKSNDTQTVTDSLAGVYTVTLAYSAPEDFTHRQSETFTPETSISLSASYSDNVTIAKGAVITIDSDKSSDSFFYAEDDEVLASDFKYTYTNLWGYQESSSEDLSKNVKIQYNNGSVWTDLPDEGITLGTKAVSFQAVYSDGTAANNATSTAYTITPVAKITPSKVEITSSSISDVNIDTANVVGQAYTINSLTVKLSYDDSQTKEDVAVITNGEIVDENFTVTVGGTAYGSFTQAYTNLGEKNVVVTLKDGSYKVKPNTKDVTATSKDLDDQKTVNFTRNPAIGEISYSNTDTLYQRSVITPSEFTFTYYDAVNTQTSLNGGSNGVTFSITSAYNTEQNRLPASGSEATVTVTYLGVSQTYTITGIQADLPVSVEGVSVTTAYKATSNAFAATSEGFKVTFNSGVVETGSADKLAFAVGETAKKVGDSITTADNAKKIVASYDGTALTNNFGSIEYSQITSLTVVPQADVTRAVLQNSTINGSDFVASVTMNFADKTSATASDYTLSQIGSTATLYSTVSFAPEVTINGETVTGTEPITVQVVANEYELAAYNTTLTVEASGNTAFAAPEKYNMTEDGKALLFLGWYDEAGRTVGFGSATEASPVYITVSGTVQYSDEITVYTNGIDATTAKYPVGYTVTKLINNSSSEAVTLHPILVAAEDYMTLTDGVASKADGKSIPASAVVGISKDIKAIESMKSPFNGNKNISMIVFEKGTELSAFANRSFTAMKLSLIEIPSTVTSLEEACLADGESEALYVDYADTIAIQTIGGWAFSGTEVVNLTIPASATSITNYAFINNAALNTLIIESGAKSLPGNAFANCNASIDTVYVPTSATLDANSFVGLNINTIVMEGQQSLSSIKDNSPWGASEATVSWTVKNQVSATPSDYFKVLYPGETFTATLSIKNADGSDKETVTSVGFTVPSGISTGTDQTFTLDYEYEESTITISFTGIAIVDKNAKIIDSASLASFLSSDLETGYVGNDFTTDAFTIAKSKKLVGVGSPTISLESITDSATGYITVTADNVTIEGITFVIAETASVTASGEGETPALNTKYFIDIAGSSDAKISGFKMTDVTLDNTADVKVGGGVHAVHLDAGNFTNCNVPGQNVNLVPFWFEDSSASVVDTTFGQNGGSYAYSRFHLAGSDNSITLTGAIPRFDRYSAEAAYNGKLITFSNITGAGWAANCPNNSPSAIESGTIKYYDPDSAT